MKEEVLSFIDRVLGEDLLERYLTIASLVSFLAFIGATGVWLLLDRPYNKFTIGILIALAFSILTLGLRYHLVESKDQIKTLAKSNAEKWGVSVQEAQELLNARIRKEVYERWLYFTILLLMISILIALFWPF